MNIHLLYKLLALVAMLIGGSMAFSLPWAYWAPNAVWKYERQGFLALLGSMAICFTVGGALRYLGRNGTGQLFRKEAMAVVGLSWVLATILGALPFALSGTRVTPERSMSMFTVDGFVDAMFESQSGFSTTGATVLTDLEVPDDGTGPLVARCILFWRSSTHFLGGLGIIVLFVAILGQGSAGKALMRAEMPGPSSSTPQARMQHTAWVLFLIYSGLNASLAVLLMLEGLSPFDAICHAFGTMATGGFSTYNASVGHFAAVGDPHAPLIEMTITVFMVLAGTNFMLMYWVLIGQPRQMLADVEWRTYICVILAVTVLVVGFGLYCGDFGNFSGMTATEQAKQDAPNDDPLSAKTAKTAIRMRR
ncbi:MAG: TrkH family potassium uptake protein [Candidatus Nealsonbacteria bacterium]|nr:TrkH family potassium uptake protein [Candidatus Nealsonbacteria bacterium]